MRVGDFLQFSVVNKFHIAGADPHLEVELDRGMFFQNECCSPEGAETHAANGHRVRAGFQPDGVCAIPSRLDTVLIVFIFKSESRIRYPRIGDVHYDAFYLSLWFWLGTSGQRSKKQYSNTEHTSSDSHDLRSINQEFEAPKCEIAEQTQANSDEPCRARQAPLRWADGSRSLPLKVEDEEGNVVLLRAGGVVAGKTGDALEEGVGETRGRNIALRFQKFFAT
jgi:hypothetical protein